MNWKTDLKLNELEGTTEFELTCKRCRITRVTTQGQLVRTEPGLSRLYLEEVEASLHCTQPRCKGGVKLVMLHDGKEEGFVGGMA